MRCQIIRSLGLERGHYFIENVIFFFVFQSGFLYLLASALFLFRSIYQPSLQGIILEERTEVLGVDPTHRLVRLWCSPGPR